MKFYIVPFALLLALDSCAPEKPPATASNTKAPIYYKQGVSDKQMTSDLNDCAYESFKKSVESDAAPSSDDIMKGCMHSMGYEISYN